MDTSSSLNILPASYYQRHELGVTPHGCKTLTRLVGFDGISSPTGGMVQRAAQAGAGRRTLDYIISCKVKHIILRLAGLKQLGISVDYSRYTMVDRDKKYVHCYAIDIPREVFLNLMTPEVEVTTVGKALIQHTKRYEGIRVSLGRALVAGRYETKTILLAYNVHGTGVKGGVTSEQIK